MRERQESEMGWEEEENRGGTENNSDERSRVEAFTRNALESIHQLRRATAQIESQRKQVAAEFGDDKLRQFMQEHQKMLDEGSLEGFQSAQQSSTLDATIQQQIRGEDLSLANANVIQVPRYSNNQQLAFSQLVPGNVDCIVLKLRGPAGLILRIACDDGFRFFSLEAERQKQQQQMVDGCSHWEATFHQDFEHTLSHQEIGHSESMELKLSYSTENGTLAAFANGVSLGEVKVGVSHARDNLAFGILAGEEQGSIEKLCLCQNQTL